jgi:hypothetical protein
VRAAAIAFLIAAATLTGCGGSSPATSASSQGPAPGSFAVHMNGQMTTEVGAAGHSSP